MKKLLVGIDGTERGEKALLWAVHETEYYPAEITLLHVIDSTRVGKDAAESAEATSHYSQVLKEARDKAEAIKPGISIATKILVGNPVRVITETASDYNAVVMGTHHGPSASETFTGAKGLNVSIDSTVPTIVVPFDWDPENEKSGMMVGVAPDNSSDSAIAIAAEYAKLRNEELSLVSAWGLPAFLDKPAKAMGGGYGPVGQKYQDRLDGLAKYLEREYPEVSVTTNCIEGSPASKVLVKESKNHRILLLGAHPRGAVGRAIFGSVTHSVLMNITVPTVIVPQP